MNYLSDIITYVRRLVKTPNNTQITDNLIIDYINRFWLMDVDARLQLFDLKTTYQFQTTPGVDKYNMPLYEVQVEGTAPNTSTIAPFPVYQGFMQSCYVNGIQVPFYTQRDAFWNLWPNYLQFLNPAAYGDGTPGPYTISLPYNPAVPGHVDITGIIANVNDGNSYMDPILVPSGPSTNLVSVPTTSVYSAVYFTATGANGQNIIAADSGQFLSDNSDGDLYGLLLAPGNAPFGNMPLSGGYSTTSNTVNYNTGVATITFTDPVSGAPVDIPAGTPIEAQCYFYQQGLPRAILFYNNCLTIRPPPDVQYLIELNAYLSPAAFLISGDAIPFGYMAEYIARGAARKLLADTGDTEQFMFYEPLFREQEALVWKRSQRQFTATRTGTIFSDLQGQSNYNSIGQGST
jgi:hypothetical protein